MRLSTALSSTLLAVLAASCGGSDAADVDYNTLIQNGDFDKAKAAIETQLAAVEKGTDEHKELVVGLAAALAESSPEESSAKFLEFAKANVELVNSKDYRYVVDQLRTYEHYTVAVSVMDDGKKRWPEDATMDAVLDALKNDIQNSGDEDAKNAMKGLGYL